MSTDSTRDGPQLTDPMLESRSASEGGSTRLLGRGSDVDPVLSVVLPTLNEERGVEVVIEQIKDAIDELELTAEIIVSDSSTDRTPEIARDLGAIVLKPEKTGYGNAYKYAFEHARGEFIAIGDADTTYDFRELPKLFDHALRTDADMVMGSRFAGEIKPGAMPPLHKYVGNPLLTQFLNLFYEAGVSDAHSGMRVIRAEALEALDLRSGGMEFASEMIMDAATKGMKIEEVPITYHERVGEATLDSFSDGWRHVKFMLTNAPGYLFTVPSVVFVLLGLAIIAGSVWHVTIGTINFGIQTLVGGVLFTMVGYQVGTLGLFSSIAGNPIRDPQDPFTHRIQSQFTLELGASIGVALFTIGALFLSYGAIAWSIHGIVAVPPASWNLLAAVAVVLGVQTVFNSFFMSLLAQSTQ